MESKHTQIPNYLEASSRKELVLECLKNNTRLNQYVHYFDFYESKDGKHVCWYYEDVTDAVLSQSFKRAKK